jgi:hypothetical protein
MANSVASATKASQRKVVRLMNSPCREMCDGS